MAKGRENLKVPSSDEARRNGRKGGLKSAEKRKELKLLSEYLEILSSLPSDKRKNLTRIESMCLAMVEEAEKGNVQAFIAARDTMGQKPTDKKEVSGPDGGPLQFEGGVTLPESVQRLIDKVKGC